MKQPIATRIAALWCVVISATATLFPAAAQQRSSAGRCIPATLDVALAPGEGISATISGTFCSPSRPDVHDVIDILVHGATYDRSYWDSGFDGSRYSYVQRALAAGRATFAYDRLGIGKSSPLSSTSVTMYADAYVLHQILQHFHAQFHEVNLLGHSYGSRIAQLESAEFNDAARLVLTGSLHAVGPALTTGELVLRQASRDPQFAGSALDSGWTTTASPAGRAPFYDVAGADPREIAYDDAHKSIVSSTEFQQGIAIGRVPADSNISNRITRPVLLMSGEEDRLSCGLALDCTDALAVKANEQPFYTHAASLTVVIVPNTGHDLALHLSAGASFEAINQWLLQTPVH
jgi:pimeloyl-ACP methyl ester carboxylesterase